jgi:hypothetical protein
MTTQPISSETESIDIIDVIRKLRNDLIKDFLDERILIDYLSAQYKIMNISAIKAEFIKADLRRMLIAPVDVELYKPIIEDFKTTGSASLSEGNEKLFYREIESMLKKFIYAPS